MVRAALSARRAMETINFLAANPRAYTLSELARAIDVSLASMTAILSSMVSMGFLVRNPNRKTYELGPALVTIGRAASERHPIVDLAQPEMRRLADLGYEVTGSVPVGEDILVAAIEGRPRGSSPNLWQGQRLPLVPPFGTIFLAWMGPGEIANWRSASKLPESSIDLDEVLRVIRERGYSIGLDIADVRARRAELIRALVLKPGDDVLRAELLDTIEMETEYWLLHVEPHAEYNIANIAAPVFDLDGNVVYALTVLDIGRITGHRLQGVVDELLSSTRQLTRQLGGRPPARET